MLNNILINNTVGVSDSRSWEVRPKIPNSECKLFLFFFSLLEGPETYCEMRRKPCVFKLFLSNIILHLFIQPYDKITNITW